MTYSEIVKIIARDYLDSVTEENEDSDTELNCYLDCLGVDIKEELSSGLEP